MLTPAEELGLSGAALAGRVRRAFHHIPEPALVDLMQRIRDESLRRHLIYLRDGQPDAVHVMPCPLAVLPDQVAYCHIVSLTIQNALKRLPELYFQDFAVRELLQLSPEEDKWLWDCWSPSHRDNNPVFGRHDAVVDFTSPMWKDSLRFLEPNLSGIGGLHLVPTAEHILADLVLPLLRGNDPELRLEVGADIRQLLMQEVLEHLETLGRPARNLCFVEPKYAASGPDEQEVLAQYFHDRFGLKLMHADPAELTLSKGEVCYNGDPVDLAYRDYAVSDLMDCEKEGVNVEPMRGAVSAESHHLVDRRRTRSEKLLGSADRSADDAEVFQRGRAANLSPARPVDAHPLGPPHDAAGRPAGRLCSTTFAANTRRWC